MMNDVPCPFVCLYCALHGDHHRLVRTNSVPILELATESEDFIEDSIFCQKCKHDYRKMNDIRKSCVHKEISSSFLFLKNMKG